MAEREADPLRIKLKNVRLSYPHLYKAKAFGDGAEGEPKYNAAFIMDPETKIGRINIALIEDAIDHAMNEKWPKGAPKLSSAKKCLRSGDDLEEVKDGYEGMVYLTASESKRPRVLDIDSEDVRDGDEGAPYAGCFVDAIVRVWAQDNKYGKRVNAGLIAVKFREDGEAFGGAAPFDKSEFDDDEDEKPKGRSRSRDDHDEKPKGRGRSRDDDEDEKPKGRSRSRDDDDEPPARRRSSRDDDEDEKPKGRSRSSRDDDDEPPPRRRASRDDDEDEKPKGRSRSRDDDDEPPARRRSRDDEDERPARRRRNDDDVA